ncbi:MAG TPA: cupin domain-containing protein [Tepidiformaceae bacterium]|nr:cupin domain-containing protein [Tepidiformaceae bacterium]
MSIEHLYLKPGEGETVSLRGTEVIFKAAGQRETGGPTVIEFVAAPGFSTGDHVHGKVEEIFYVVDGEFDIRGGEWSGHVGPGSIVRIAPGTAHGFGNPGHSPATILLIISPGGVHDGYFRELASILAGSGQPDGEAIAELRERYDTTQVSALKTS